MLNDPIMETRIRQREELFMNLYKSCFPSVARYVSRMNGSLEQAKDVFQDALLIFYEKQRSGSGPDIASEAAYLTGIARHLWLKRYKENSHTEKWTASADKAQDETGQPSPAKVLRYLETAGRKCMELLRAFYYEEANLSQIASDFGFSGVRSATVQKFKCLEKVREKIKEKALSYEDFLE
jgi:DNA-directed RNA polymerase specialized sigma24 family protein